MRTDALSINPLHDFILSKEHVRSSRFEMLPYTNSTPTSRNSLHAARSSISRNRMQLFSLETGFVDTRISVSPSLPSQAPYFSPSTYTSIIILFLIPLAKAISCSSLAYISHIIRSIYFSFLLYFPRYRLISFNIILHFSLIFKACEKSISRPSSVIFTVKSELTILDLTEAEESTAATRLFYTKVCQAGKTIANEMCKA